MAAVWSNHRTSSDAERKTAIYRPRLRVRVCGLATAGSTLFSIEIDAGMVKALTDRNLAGDGQRRAFTPAMILFIALSEVQDKTDPG
jgi:hypothetical protein